MDLECTAFGRKIRFKWQGILHSSQSNMIYSRGWDHGVSTQMADLKNHLPILVKSSKIQKRWNEVLQRDLVVRFYAPCPSVCSLRVCSNTRITAYKYCLTTIIATEMYKTSSPVPQRLVWCLCHCCVDSRGSWNIHNWLNH